jgi:hypothetical protein
MSELLPWIFVITAVIAIVGGLFSLWLSLSLALSDEPPDETRMRLTSDARLALFTEKEALLQEIRDVAFEHDAGKLSDRDYEELNAKLRAQARHILHQLDEGAAEYREEAEALIARRLGEKK